MSGQHLTLPTIRRDGLVSLVAFDEMVLHGRSRGSQHRASSTSSPKPAGSQRTKCESSRQCRAQGKAVEGQGKAVDRQWRVRERQWKRKEKAEERQWKSSGSAVGGQGKGRVVRQWKGSRRQHAPHFVPVLTSRALIALGSTNCPHSNCVVCHHTIATASALSLAFLFSRPVVPGRPRLARRRWIVWRACWASCSRADGSCSMGGQRPLRFQCWVKCERVQPVT